MTHLVVNIHARLIFGSIIGLYFSFYYRDFYNTANTSSIAYLLIREADEKSGRPVYRIL
jgi:hypothetical protein